MSGESKLIISEITVSKVKGEALVKAIEEENTEAATKSDCDCYGKK